MEIGGSACKECGTAVSAVFRLHRDPLSLRESCILAHAFGPKGPTQLSALGNAQGIHSGALFRPEGPMQLSALGNAQSIHSGALFRPEGPTQLSALGNAQGIRRSLDLALKGQRSAEPVQRS